MNELMQFLKDDTRRLLEITQTTWIKRVYTENGILFEWENAKKDKGATLNTYDKKSDVLEWYEQL
ncbi:hypothetical protein MLC52_05460 [Sulfurimonas sp. NW15]|uniref:hypothetical protein n=1 Tax=Sulfurimonas sp. NW15 TaxID=2922729 RepID=UPI003DA962A7